MLITLALRVGVLLLGIGLGVIAAASWQSGSPPAWSFAATRAETVVRTSQVRNEIIGNGTTRHHPVVMVSWPPGSDTQQELASLRSVMTAYRRDEAEAVVAAHPPGRRLLVRVLDGRPHADRHDRFQLFHAAFMSVMSLIITALGALFFVIFRDDAKPSSPASPPSNTGKPAP